MLVERAIASDPVSAGFRAILDKLANDAISFETKKSTALALLQGFQVFSDARNVPADLTQYYVHCYASCKSLRTSMAERVLTDWTTLMMRRSPMGPLRRHAELQELQSHCAILCASDHCAGNRKRIARKALMKTTWYPVEEVSESDGVSVNEQKHGENHVKDRSGSGE